LTCNSNNNNANWINIRKEYQTKYYLNKLINIITSYLYYIKMSEMIQNKNNNKDFKLNIVEATTATAIKKTILNEAAIQKK
jgi:hypothetical protein